MPARPHLNALTTLRFVAALFIYVHHALGKFGLPDHREVGLAFGIGVPFFFALSGFILAYNYAPSKEPARIARMIGYRIARIWPLHLACLTLFLIFNRNPGSPLQSLDQIVPNVFLIHSWIGSYYYAFSFNAVSWSLSVEMFFYLVFPFLLLCSSAVLVLIGAVASAITLTIATLMWGNAPMAHPVITGAAVVTTHPLASLHIFIAGLLAARSFDWINRKRIGEAGAVIVEGVAILAFLIFMFKFRQISSLMSWAVGANLAVGRWMPTIAGIAVFVPVIIAFALGKGWVSRCLSVRPAVWLGEISFAFYLCHQFLLVWLHRSFDFGPVMGVTFSLSAAIGLAALLHHFVERPAQKWLRARVDRATARRAAA